MSELIEAAKRKFEMEMGEDFEADTKIVADHLLNEVEPQLLLNESKSLEKCYVYCTIKAYEWHSENKEDKKRIFNIYPGRGVGVKPPYKLVLKWAEDYFTSTDSEEVITKATTPVNVKKVGKGTEKNNAPKQTEPPKPTNTQLSFL